jgi:hypothetical protein
MPRASTTTLANAESFATWKWYVGVPDETLTFDTVSVGLRLSTVVPAAGVTRAGAEVMDVGADGESSPQLRARRSAPGSRKTRSLVRDISNLFLSD